MNKKKQQKLFRTFISVIAVLSSVLVLVAAPSLPASAAINEQVNYQGRLLDISGGVVADGDYNIRFKIYEGGTGCVSSGSSPCGGSLEWTEEWKQTNRVRVENGYFSVELGSLTSFGSSVDWNNSTLWLSVDVGGTADTATPTYDGEMLPFRRLSAVPYAFNSGLFNGLQSTAFVQLAQGVQTDSSTSNASIFINKTGSTANILTLQRAGNNVLNIDNSGVVAFRTNSDSVTGFQVNDSDGGVPVFNVDTTNERVGVGTASPSTTLDVAGPVRLGADTSTTNLLNTSSGSAAGADLFWGNDLLCDVSETDCGGVTDLQDAYDGGNTITLTDGNDLSITAPDTATDPNIVFNLQGAGGFNIQDSGSTQFNVNDLGQTIIGGGEPFLGSLAPGLTTLTINKDGFGIQAFQSASTDPATSGAFFGARSRGTVASPTESQNGDTLFQIGATGYTSTDVPANVAGGHASLSFIQDAASTTTLSPTAVVFRSTPSTETVRITSGGDVGIGESAPAHKLDVAGSIRLGDDTSDNNELNTSSGSAAGADLFWGNDLLCDSSETNCGLASSATAFIQGGNSFGTKAHIGTNDVAAVGIRANGNERITVLSGGNVGINDSTPSVQLDVGGSARFQAFSHQIRIFDDDTVTDEWSIGTLVSDSQALGFYENGVNAKFWITAGGALHAPTLFGSSAPNESVRYSTGTGQIYYQTSLREYKDDITDVDFDTSIIYDFDYKAYDPVRPDTREPDGDRTLGVIAQDVEELLQSRNINPRRFLTYDGENELRGFSYDQLTIPTIKELEKVKISVDELKNSTSVAAVTDMNQRLDDLTKKVEALSEEQSPHSSGVQGASTSVVSEPSAITLVLVGVFLTTIPIATFTSYKKMKQEMVG